MAEPDGEGGVDDLDAPAPHDAQPDQQPDQQPRPTRTHRRPRRRTVLAASALVVLLVAGALVRQAVVRESSGPPLDGTATAEELFPVLAEASDAGGAFPTDQARAGLGVVPGSAHLLAATPTLVFWVALDDSGEVCLVVRRGELPVRIGGACTAAGEAADRGVSLPEGGLAATLVPRGFDARALSAAGDSELADGLWVDAATAELVVEEAVDAVVAQPVVPAQSGTGSGALPVFLTDDGATYAVVLSCLSAPTAGVVATLVVDRERDRRACSTDLTFRRFVGDGGPVRVDVEVPGRLTWAGRVVRCAGSLTGPVCDSTRFP